MVIIVRFQHWVLFVHLNPAEVSMITMTPPVNKGRNRGEGTDKGKPATEKRK